MKKPRRPRSDSAASAVAAARNVKAALPIPPIELCAEAFAFWEGIVASRATDEWDDPSLFAGACLAQTQAAIVEESGLFATEGAVIDGKLNPRHKVLDELHKRSTMYLRTLRLGGQALGDIRNKVNARRLEQQARMSDAELDEIDPDGYLAR